MSPVMISARVMPLVDDEAEGIFQTEMLLDRGREREAAKNMVRLCVWVGWCMGVWEIMGERRTRP